MSTRLYLQNDLATVIGRPSDTETQGEGDGGHVGASRLLCRRITKAKGAAQVELSWAEPYPDPEVDHHCLLGLWISPPLATAQTLESGMIVSVAAALQGNLPDPIGGLELRVFAYLWRSGMGRVATLSAASVDSRSLTGTATRSNNAHETFFIVECAALGAEVRAHQRDRIVVELWAHFHVDEVGGGVGTYRAFWGGSDDTAGDGDTVADAAAYVEISQTLDMEAAMDAGQILVGARDVEVDDVNLGALDGGVEYKREDTILEHEVDQRLGIVGTDRVKERVTVTCHMKEATLENVRIAMAQPSWQLSGLSASPETLNFGGQRAMPTHTVTITGKAPGTDKTRTLYLRSAVVIGGGSHAYTKGAATILDVEFLCIEDQAQAEGFRYGYFEDEDGVFAFA